MEFSSLKHVPSETRTALRMRFDGFLKVARSNSVRRVCEDLLDEQLLRLLHLAIIKFNSEEDASRKFYKGGFGTLSSMTFDDLISNGWVRIKWGRMSTLGRELYSAMERIEPEVKEGILALFNNRYAVAVDFRSQVNSNSKLKGVAARIKAGELSFDHVKCTSPEWVAARLWDRYANKIAGRDVVRWWIDRWIILGSPSIVPSIAWSETACEDFVRESLSLLSREESILNWDDFGNVLHKQYSLTFGGDYKIKLSSAGSLLERYIRLVSCSPASERVVFANLYDFSFWGVVRVLLAEVNSAENGKAPHPIAQSLFELAVDRPELLWCVVECIKQKPSLLADLVLFSKTSVLACFVISTWTIQGGAWDRDALEGEQWESQVKAFQDALSVSLFLLRENKVFSNEIAVMFVYLHNQNGVVGDYGRTALVEMLSIFRNSIGELSQVYLSDIYAAIIYPENESPLGSAEFVAALDVVSIGDVSQFSNPSDLVLRYVRSLRAPNYSITAYNISKSSSVALVRLAMFSESTISSQFFYPFDMKNILAGMSESDSDGVSRRHLIGLALRAHIQVLSRAVSAWPDKDIELLVSALVVAVKSGVFDNDEKGRIAAFDVSYETARYDIASKNPIANDLAAALHALDDGLQDKLLDALLLTNEPFVLAKLLSLSPIRCRARIEMRLCNLPPGEVPDVWSLPEAQARIDALLDASAVSMASQYIEVEAGLKTFGRVPGRAVMSLRNKLRLNMLQGDWQALLEATSPDELPPAEAREAHDTVVFYRALAALYGEFGDISYAVNVFGDLYKKNPTVPAYQQNYFAAQISSLLKDDAFGVINGEDALVGRRLLSEIDSAESFSEGGRYESTNSMNKCLLLLSLGESERAYKLVCSINQVEEKDRKIAYTAVALSRLGGAIEALGMIEHALKEDPQSNSLNAARSHLAGNKSLGFSPSIVSEEDLITGVRIAYAKLVSMSAGQQARVIHPLQDLTSFIFEQVRLACASLGALVPMMDFVKLDGCEDDINSLLREVLTARLSFLKWHVADQSLGGYTGRGNPGERDIVIKFESSTLAVVEALRCDRPTTQQSMVNDLASHFQKSFGYSECSIFVHVTYCTLDDGISSVLDALIGIAQTSVPMFNFINLEMTPSEGTMPSGFISTYRRHGEMVKVLFLVLDIKQNSLRIAARIASDTKANTGESLPEKAVSQKAKKTKV